MIHNQTRAYCFAIAAVLLWSTVASAFKISLRTLSVGELTFWASLTAVLVLSLLMVITGRWRSLKDYDGRDVLRSAILGGLNPFFYYLVLFQAYDLLPAQQAQPLNAVWPIVLVILAALILGQRIRLLTYPAMLISFSGVWVISSQGHVFDVQIDNPFGVFLALFSAFVWASYWIIGMKDHRDPLSRLALNFGFGCSYMLIYQLVSGELRWPSTDSLLAAIYVGCFEMGITFFLWLKALQLARTAADVSGFIYILPFLSLVCIHFVLGETIHISTLAGLCLIIAGLILQRFAQR